MTTPSSPWRARLDLDAPGGPAVRGCGVAVAEVVHAVADGATMAALLARHPGLCADDVRACLAYALEWVEGEQTVTLPPAGEGATLPPTPAAAAAGRAMIPGYEVLGELGRGGMGVVYKARQVKLGRVVALKMILAGAHADDEVRARFQTEAEAVARLQHPGIVQIFEVGEHEGHSFLALEFVEGGSLADRLTDQPWDANEAAALVEKLAEAVQAAHDRGIVHRDLKPENVLLCSPVSPTPGDDRVPEGRGYIPKITDFGLAKKLDTDGRTRTGAVMGTPAYMAPEQAAGKKDVGTLADVYALGGILYRLLAGRPAFDGATTFDVMLRVLEEEPPPFCERNPKVPRDLETVAMKCLSKDPAKRYASAGELAADLRRFQDGEPIGARNASMADRAVAWGFKHPGQVALRGLAVLCLMWLVQEAERLLMLHPRGGWYFMLLFLVPCGIRIPGRATLLGWGLAMPCCLAYALLLWWDVELLGPSFNQLLVSSVGWVVAALLTLTVIYLILPRRYRTPPLARFLIWGVFAVSAAGALAMGSRLGEVGERLPSPIGDWGVIVAGFPCVFAVFFGAAWRPPDRWQVVSAAGMLLPLLTWYPRGIELLAVGSLLVCILLLGRLIRLKPVFRSVEDRMILNAQCGAILGGYFLGVVGWVAWVGFLQEVGSRDGFAGEFLRFIRIPLWCILILNGALCGSVLAIHGSRTRRPVQ